ncbi:L,D-transpeptidase family protein [Paracoccus saliphilus]|uniref:Lipoprotein-anchoring transpeptidase ErfK/SrfK n=1 Tax=Paracoccus saliphilus TaxID=405559 RepID=A0AA46A580_9RHOB|nr:L,D-transpeptidase [Paracoccus saliphilus]WCR02487.1 murein L,D-transpeptidase [Paracoccus saliphilus]SIS76333.1 Lipoprotein-anchoring transpeptidase ErfK/SrfK [Paracoccus saliphilus]
MPFRPYRTSLALIMAMFAAVPALGQDGKSGFSAADIEAASYQGGDLPAGQSPLTAKVQVLLDRSGTSPGVIDGYKGGMSESALMAFERRAGLPIDGRMDPQVWQLLLPYAAQPQTMDYTITEEDAQGLVDAIPSDYAEKAQMSAMAYTSVAEKLGERFHMDEKFIAFLNPGTALVPGATIKVISPAKPIKTKVTRIIVDKATRRVAAYDADGEMIVDYPATVGSDATPSPSGHHTVVTVALNPNYTYNPEKNFKQGDNDKALIVPPGPNGPVGNVWIDLTKPTYGIHGTPTPSRLFRNQSNGCVRLTNWDARELAGMVIPGKTKVEFLEPGVTIADVTGGQIAPAEGVIPATAVATATTAASAAVTRPVTTAKPTLSARAPLPRPAWLGRSAATADTTMTTEMATTGTATARGNQPAGISAATEQSTAPLPPVGQPQPAGAPAPVAGTQPVYENTSEEEADGFAPATTQNPVDDLLSEALSNAIPESDIVPPAPVQPQ